MQALVVDDSRAMRRILKGILADHGYDVIEAENGAAALNALEVFQDVRVALVDWGMPVMTGIEFVEQVRSESRFEGMRIVMVTTEAEPEKMARALASGVDEFVVKPFVVEVLLEKLKRVGVPLAGKEAVN